MTKNIKHILEQKGALEKVMLAAQKKDLTVSIYIGIRDIFGMITKDNIETDSYLIHGDTLTGKKMFNGLSKAIKNFSEDNVAGYITYSFMHIEIDDFLKKINTDFVRDRCDSTPLDLNEFMAYINKKTIKEDKKIDGMFPGFYIESSKLKRLTPEEIISEYGLITPTLEISSGVNSDGKYSYFVQSYIKESHCITIPLGGRSGSTLEEALTLYSQSIRDTENGIIHTDIRKVFIVDKKIFKKGIQKFFNIRNSKKEMLNYLIPE